jgi:hypothetical protein
VREPDLEGLRQNLHAYLLFFSAFLKRDHPIASFALSRRFCPGRAHFTIHMERFASPTDLQTSSLVYLYAWKFFQIFPEQTSEGIQEPGTLLIPDTKDLEQSIAGVRLRCNFETRSESRGIENFHQQVSAGKIFSIEMDLAMRGLKGS